HAGVRLRVEGALGHRPVAREEGLLDTLDVVGHLREGRGLVVEDVLLSDLRGREALRPAVPGSRGRPLAGSLRRVGDPFEPCLEVTPEVLLPDDDGVLTAGGVFGSAAPDL